MVICHLKKLFKIKINEQDFHTLMTLKYAHKSICIQYSSVNCTMNKLSVIGWSLDTLYKLK